MSVVWNSLSEGNKHMRLYASLFALAALVGGCSSCDPEAGGVKAGSVAGRAIKGVIGGAKVTAYTVDDRGRREGEIGTAETADDGTFTVDVEGHAGNALVCASGGTYTEESTGSLVQVGPLELCALVTDLELGEARSNVLLTPWSSMHTELASCFVELGREASLQAGANRAALRLNDFLAAGTPGFDFASTVPADITALTGLSLSPEAWAGVLLAGLSETATGISAANGSAPGVRFTAVSLADALRRDIAGSCVFDGLGVGGAVIAEGVVELGADTLRGAAGGLANSIGAFLRGTRNTSGIDEATVDDLLRRLAAHESEIFAAVTDETDLDKPLVTFSTPEAGSTRGGVVRVEVTAEDSSEIPTFEFLSPAQATFLAAEPTCTTDELRTVCTLAGNLNTSLAPITDGPVTISVRATDAAGNAETANLSFTANNSLPVITIVAPTDRETLSGVRTISATATDADGIESLTVDVPGIGLCSSEPGSPLADVEPATGLLTCSWNTSLSPEGEVVLTFRARDAAGQEAVVPRTVVVNNVATSSLRGVIDLAAPVVGATVRAVDWSGRERGELIAETTSDESGAFSIQLDDNSRASVLLIATGGVYVDPASGLSLTMGGSEELTAAAGGLQPGEDRLVNINAWTTLAATRSVHTPPTVPDAFAISENHVLISRHLRRPPGSVFDVSRVQSASLSLAIAVSSERAVLALSHAALSRLAAEISIENGGAAVGTITMTELVGVLASDLRVDPLLDGKQGEEPLTVGPRSKPITSFTTRFDLAAALDRFLGDIALPGVTSSRNGTGISRSDALNALIYQHLAEDADRNLYPEGEPPRPFDTVGPVVTLSFSDGNFGRLFGESLRGQVTIDGLAVDAASSVVDAFATVDGVNPLPDANNAVDRLRLAIGTEVGPDSAGAIAACADNPLAADAEAIENGVCVCAIAEDANDNVGDALLCFTRPPPLPEISLPPAGTVFNATASASLSFSVSSGFDLEACNAILSRNPAAAVPALNPPIATGPSCTFSQSLSPGALSDGQWTLTARARDIAGRSVEASRAFTVDTTPPSVTVTSPASGAVGRETTFTMQGTVSGTGDLESITVDAPSRSVSVTVPLAASATTWSVPITLTGSENGPVNFSVTARDVNGNLRQIATVYVLDTVAPVSALSVSQPVVVDYDADQPIAPVGLTILCPIGQTCIDSRAMSVTSDARKIPHANVFVASGNPSEPIVRWESHLPIAAADAPTVLVTASDANGPASVRFSLSNSCTTAPNRTAVATTATEFAIKLGTENFTGVTLPAQSGATNLCLVIESSDSAGNASPRITRTFRWRTIAPPLTVSMNTGATDRVYPGGIPDAANAFKGVNLVKWQAAEVAQYGVMHGWMRNPFNVPVRGVLTVAGGTAVPMNVDLRRRERWTTSSIPTAPGDEFGVAPGGPLQNICNLQYANSSPRPYWPDAISFCGTSTVTGTQFRFTRLALRSGRLEADTTLVQRNVNTKPVSKADVTSTVSPVTINLSTVLYFSANANGEPQNQIFADAGGVVTVPPLSNVMFVVTGQNQSTVGAGLSFYRFASDVEEDASRMFFTAANHNPSLPAISMSNTVFTRVNGTSTKPDVFVWGNNLSGNNLSSDQECDAGECALGLKWTQVDRIRVNRAGTTQRLVMRTRLNTAADQNVTWSTASQFPDLLRSVAAPVSP